MAKAFAGVRVLDFTQVLAGPFCAEQLALQGADVIKIERPRTGDQSRQLMADNEIGRTGMSPMFIGVNAGKRGMTLDLQHPKAKEVILKLVATADVVVENFKAGNMDRLGLGYAALKAVKPDLIYTSISGFGQKGPYAGAAAYDGAIQATSGMMSVTGYPETGPTREGAPVVDIATGTMAAFATASALYRRNVTGEGQHIDVAMFDTALNLMSAVLSCYVNAGELMPLVGNSSLTRLPTADLFTVSDGYILMSCLTQSQWIGLCKAIGRLELVDDPRFADNPGRIAHAGVLRPLLLDIFATDTGAAWEKRLSACGVPAAEVMDLPRVVQHEQLAHRNVLVKSEPPPGWNAPVTLIGSAYVTSADTPMAERPPPALGQHTDAILAEIGYDPAAISALRAEKVI